MSNLQNKRGFACAQSHEWDVGAFQQDWFIEKSGKNLWVRRLTIKRYGQIAGYFPYAVKLRQGNFLFGGAQEWAHISAPVLRNSLTQQERDDVLGELAMRLPRWISLRLVFNPGETSQASIAAFRKAGFTHERQITFREMPDDPDVMNPENARGLDRKRRGNIQRAAKRVRIFDDLSAAEFIAFYQENLAALGVKSYYQLAAGRALITAGQAQTLQGRFFTGADGELWPARRVMIFAAYELDGGKLAAAIACLCDDTYCYYWLTTRRRAAPAERNLFDDTVKLLVLHARARARILGLVFDADGVTNAGSRAFFRNLKFPHELNRDIFTRYSPVDSLLHRLRTRWAALAGLAARGARQQLPLITARDIAALDHFATQHR